MNAAEYRPTQLGKWKSSSKLSGRLKRLRPALMKMSLIALCMALQGCLAATIAGSAASSVSAYWSYKAATADTVEVLARECLLEPVYLSRESTLTTEDKRQLAAHNAAMLGLCK